MAKQMNRSKPIFEIYPSNSGLGIPSNGIVKQI